MKVVAWFLSLNNYGLHGQAKPTGWAELVVTGVEVVGGLVLKT